MRVCKHGCDVLDSRVLLSYFIKAEAYASDKGNSTFSVFTDLDLTIGGLGEFSKVIEILDYVSGLHNCLEFSQPSSCLESGYVNTEKVLYCLSVVPLKRLEIFI